MLPEADEATILTVWLPLTDATEQNGCMQVIPRSHREGLKDHCPVDQLGSRTRCCRWIGPRPSR